MASNLKSLQKVLTKRAVFVHDDTFAKASLTSDQARTIKGIQFLPSSSASSSEEIIPKAPYVVKPPEKKHRLPFAYSRFMRTSPLAFTVPYSLYMESVKNNHSIGMRFKMRFEGEEAPEQRFTGTIVGIGDIDSSLWSGSEWRCFKVRWDENSSIPRPERVSPWKLEPALAPPVNSFPVPRPKRPRTSAVPPSPDASSVVTREGLFIVSEDILQSHGRSRPFPGQDITTLRRNFTADSNVSEVITPKYNMRPPPSFEEERNEACTPRRKLGSENWIKMGRHEPTTFTNMLSGFRTSETHKFFSPLFDHNPSGNALSENHEEGELTLFPSQC